MFLQEAVFFLQVGNHALHECGELLEDLLFLSQVVSGIRVRYGWGIIGLGLGRQGLLRLLQRLRVRLLQRGDLLQQAHAGLPSSPQEKA